MVERRIYRVAPDHDANAKRFMRVIDESDEDYLYPASYLVQPELAPDIEQALLATM